jgi:hypothetical protein
VLDFAKFGGELVKQQVQLGSEREASAHPCHRTKAATMPGWTMSALTAVPMTQTSRPAYVKSVRRFNSDDRKRRMPDAPLDLKSLKGSEFFRLLEYAVTKAVANQDMAAAEIRADLGIFPFKNFQGVIIEQQGDCPPEPGTTMGVPSFRVMPQAFLAYLQYRQLEDATEAAAQAERHATQATWIAIVSIVVSVLSSIASLLAGVF